MKVVFKAIKGPQIIPIDFELECDIMKRDIKLLNYAISIVDCYKIQSIVNYLVSHKFDPNIIQDYANCYYSPNFIKLFKVEDRQVVANIINEPMAVFFYTCETSKKPLHPYLPLIDLCWQNTDCKDPNHSHTTLQHLFEHKDNDFIFVYFQVFTNAYMVVDEERIMIKGSFGVDNNNKLVKVKTLENIFNRWYVDVPEGSLEDFIYIN